MGCVHSACTIAYKIPQRKNQRVLLRHGIPVDWQTLRFCRGFYVSTVGRDETVIREYSQKQEEEDKRLEQMNLWR
jgi:REP element-mobilizing transposase RayT